MLNRSIDRIQRILQPLRALWLFQDEQKSHVQSYLLRKKIISVSTTIAKVVLPGQKYNQIIDHFGARHPLYHKKLKPLIPAEWQNKISADLWEKVASFCFHLDGLRCDLSGKLLENSVFAFGRMNMIYEKSFLDQFEKLNEKSVSKVNFKHAKDFKDDNFKKLTDFAKKHKTLQLDAKDKETKELLEMLKLRADAALQTNILYELQIAIEAEKTLGAEEFDLAAFLSLYNYPVKLSYNKVVDSNTFYFCVIMQVLVIWIFYAGSRANAEYCNKILQSVTRSPLVLLLLIGDVLQWHKFFVAAEMFLLGSFRETGIFGSMQEFAAFKSVCPESFASTAMKWMLFIADLVQIYCSPASSTGFHLILDLLWVASPTTDIACRKAVEECRQVLQDPTQLVTLGPLRDAHGFFRKPGILRSGLLERSSAVLLAAVVSYRMTENPVFVLMAMVNAFQWSALTKVLDENRRRYKFFANRPAIGAVELKSVEQVRVVGSVAI